MSHDILIQAGLSSEQALVYGVLLKHGTQPARRIAQHANLGRPLVYKLLEQLEDEGLVTKTDPDGGVAVFTPAHPGVLREKVDVQLREAQALQERVASSLGDLVSDYNLMVGKPNVQFYEGEEGMQEVLDDSLYAKEMIYTYVDIESIEKYIPKINERYAKKREKLGIKKQGIVYDTPFNRKFLAEYHTEVTESKFLTWEKEPTHTVMQIYDGKISYLTLVDQNMIGLIIEDQHIYHMHKSLFEYQWSQLPSIRG